MAEENSIILASIPGSSSTGTLGRSSSKGNLPHDLDKTAHTLSCTTLLGWLKVDTSNGLLSEVVHGRLAQYGPNLLQSGTGVKWWKLLLAQIFNAFMVVLGAALILSLVVKDWVEASCILAVIILNTVIGFIQEFKAEKTMESLRSLASPTATVVRDQGHEQFIAARDLVPGDIILVKLGDIVPADARLIEVFNLEMTEAMLTGESEPVRKHNRELEQVDTALGDRLNMLFTGTVVSKGRGKAVVVATGMKTQMGNIAKSLENATTDQKTILQKKLDRFAFGLLGCGIILGIIVFAVNRFKMSTDVVMYAISLGIAVIPESLVAVVTVTFAIGIQIMAKQHVLVRKMTALEELGSIDHICSDKTGTLTSGKMVLREFVLSNGLSGHVTGTGIEPIGNVFVETQNGPVQVDRTKAPRELRAMATCVSICNMATLNYRGVEKENAGWVGMGDSTEIALQSFAHKLEMSKPTLQKEGFEVIAEFPFDSAIKKMTVIAKDTRSGKHHVFVKGAVEKIFGASTAVLDVDERIESAELTNPDDVLTRAIDTHRDGRRMATVVDKLADKGFRVISMGCRTLTSEEVAQFGADNFSSMTREDTDRDLVFLGLVGIQDPPRADTKDSVRACHEAGITVHMLTGDHGRTAKSIAKEIGILPANYDESEDIGIAGSPNTPAPPPMRDIPLERTLSTASSFFRFAKKRDDVVIKVRNPMVMDGRDFDALSHDQIDAFIELPRVISRCSPDTKVNMVAAMKRRKKVVAMTGDGVNDAPSLKSADVGIAMGMGGSDVTKSASDIVLTNDKFSTIVQAVKQGRTIYHNLEIFISHLLATNVMEVLALIIGLAFQDPNKVSIPPMAPLQILFLNMITSSPVAIALGMDKSKDSVMKKPPRKHSTFLPHETILDTLVLGSWMGVLLLINFVLPIYALGNGVLDSECNHYSAESYDKCAHIFEARGLTFVTGTLLALVHAFACRENRQAIWANKWAAVRGNRVLYWAIGFGVVILILPVYIPKLNTVAFRHAPLNGYSWLFCIASVFLYFAGVELYKLAKRAHYARASRGHKREKLKEGFQEHIMRKEPEAELVEVVRKKVDNIDHIVEMPVQ